MGNLQLQTGKKIPRESEKWFISFMKALDRMYSCMMRNLSGLLRGFLRFL